MKITGYIYITSLLLAGGWILRAQTNATASPNLSTNANTNAVSQILALVTTNSPPAKPRPQETVIESDGPASFNEVGHGLRVIYRDNVRVDAPGLKLRCQWLAADMSQASGHPTNIVAETNVVIDATDDKGDKMHATSDKAVYVYSVQNGATNETVTLTGNARLENAQGWLTGDPIVWDRIHNHLTASNPKMVFRQGLNVVGNTNSMVVETNLPVGTNLMAIETNLPSAETRSPSATNNPTSPSD